ncbi:hypothetical protein EZV62_012363 [Acer yangbiense]|uniref:Uncharacterized protein n=1 Tax=Acer yangbiense TaxID=1000413 RepID=A0A5C7HVN6_9ROSI|nr:hypothetical protein EZV62_012363 [Acer yangbiense]
MEDKSSPCTVEIRLLGVSEQSRRDLWDCPDDDAMLVALEGNVPSSNPVENQNEKNSRSGRTSGHNSNDVEGLQKTMTELAIVPTEKEETERGQRISLVNDIVS